MLNTAEGIEPASLAAVLSHHRDLRQGGGGADHRAVPWLARIVAIADAFEGLTAVRTQFGLAMSPVDVVRRLLGDEGAGLDPVLLRAFLSTVGLFPAGTVLSLDNGEPALVVGQGADPFRPLVRMLSGADSGAIVSLAERAQGRYRRSPSFVLPMKRRLREHA